jgi:hypothetical protein
MYLPNINVCVAFLKHFTASALSDGGTLPYINAIKSLDSNYMSFKYNFLIPEKFVPVVISLFLLQQYFYICRLMQTSVVQYRAKVKFTSNMKSHSDTGLFKLMF